MEFRAFVAITIGLLQLAVTAVNVAADEPSEVSLTDRAPKLINLGNVDGKSFFADNAGRNWTAAKSYCETLGMELATITSSAQLAFLKTAYNSTAFSSVHWIDARDSFEERQFTWDKTGTPVTSLSSLTFIVSAPRYQTCVAYYSSATPSIYLYVCETAMKTLCQT